MPTTRKRKSKYEHIGNYRTELQRLRMFGGSDNESSIRRAFEICLSAYCKEHSDDLELVPELRLMSGNQPDGTVKDVLRMTRGYWEAKDTHDELDKENPEETECGLSAQQHHFRRFVRGGADPERSGSDASGHGQKRLASPANSIVS